jgi:hypothetical protein
MTEREIREVREQWDEAYERLSFAQSAIEHFRRLEASLVAECERLAKVIAEHDHAPIMTVVEPQEAKRPIKIGEAVRREQR